MLSSDLSRCPLCTLRGGKPFFEDKRRQYYLCSNCELIYVPQCFHLSPEAERQRYDLHQNSAEDLSYRNFLQTLLTPLQEYLRPGQEGLDFGCGPGPTLSLMLQEQGYSMSVYDPFYASNPDLLARQYDFITCSEAIEHFSRPAEEWQRLTGLLRDGGVLAIMTMMYGPDTDFSHWYYKNDSTHIHFYSQKTFEWVAQRDNLKLNFYGDSVVIFKMDSGRSKE